MRINRNSELGLPCLGVITINDFLYYIISLWSFNYIDLFPSYKNFH